MLGKVAEKEYPEIKVKRVTVAEDWDNEATVKAVWDDLRRTQRSNSYDIKGSEEISFNLHSSIPCTEWCTVKLTEGSLLCDKSALRDVCASSSN